MRNLLRVFIFNSFDTLRNIANSVSIFPQHRMNDEFDFAETGVILEKQIGSLQSSSKRRDHDCFNVLK